VISLCVGSRLIEEAQMSDVRRSVQGRRPSRRTNVARGRDLALNDGPCCR
jgi:hypothetical protein